MRALVVLSILVFISVVMVGLFLAHAIKSKNDGLLIITIVLGLCQWGFLGWLIYIGFDLSIFSQ